MDFTNEQLGWLIINFQNYSTEEGHSFVEGLLEFYNDDVIQID